jgi:hypothetical protein
VLALITMRRGPTALLAALILPAAASAQAPPPVTFTPPPRAPNQTIDAAYGPPQGEDLEQVANGGPSYQRHYVIVHGRLDILEAGRSLALSAGGARLMLIPFNTGDYVDYTRLLGLDVEVGGIARLLPESQAMQRCLGGFYPESKCADPLLPVLPNARMDWPAVSLTVITLSDRGTGLGRRHTGPPSLADTGIEAAAAAGKPVRAVGQFRGANLCRDVAETTRRDPADWLLLTSEGPVWVTGRRPEGKGFRLDPAYRTDTSRWLEVNGRVETAGESRYLKATRVALIPKPAESEATPCPP